MSYDLCVFALERAMSTKSALEFLDSDEWCCLDSPEALRKFHEVVCKKYPPLEEAGDKSPWASTPLLDGKRIDFCLTHSEAAKFRDR